MDKNNLTATQVGMIQNAIQLEMEKRCAEQGHVWKRVPYSRDAIECKWCGFRL